MLDIRNARKAAGAVGFPTRELVAYLRVKDYLRIYHPREDHAGCIKPAAGAPSKKVLARGGRDLEERGEASKADGLTGIDRGHVPHLKEIGRASCKGRG